MKLHPSLVLALACAVCPLQAATLSLASTMNGSGYMSEDKITGSFARINLGSGSLGSAGANNGDADGLYDVTKIGQADPGNPFGTAVDLFPREANFQIGSLSFDESLVSTTGVSIVPINSIDLAAFWTSDPNRTNSSAGNAPTVISDISDHAIGLWLFGGNGGISFGSLDAADTVTFTNGILTSVDLSITTSFFAEALGYSVAWDGVFSITGNSLSYQIDDTAYIPNYSEFVGDPRFVADLTGIVNSVGTYTIPEPSSLLLGSLGLLALARRRR